MQFIKLFVLGTIICISISACQSGSVEQFSAKETPTDWIGETPVALISAKGSPTQIINTNGTQYLIYMTADGVTFGESAGETTPGNFIMSNGFPRSSFTGVPFCQKTFIVENGLIVRAEQQGTACATTTDAAPNT